MPVFKIVSVVLGFVLAITLRGKGVPIAAQAVATMQFLSEPLLTRRTVDEVGRWAGRLKCASSV
jgi:hypothetical protein